MDNSISTTNHRPASNERKQSPPAFLDLADSAARLGSNMPDMSARVELKRLEHERQRLLQRKMFEDQMRALEQQQAQELLSIPYDANAPNGNGGIQHLAVSAPTTPPRVNTALNGETHPGARVGRAQAPVDAESLSRAVGTAADKRKSVTYAPSVNLSPDLQPSAGANGHNFSRTAGAKSMPASRRTSASSHDEELAGHLQGLSMAGEHSNRASPVPAPVSASILMRGNSRYGDDQGARYASAYNAGMMLDEQLDEEMHNAMRNLPTSDDDKYHNSYTANKVTTSSAALDLAHISQTSPRSHYRVLETREKSSEWPQFTGAPRGPDSLNSRSDRRTVTNPNLTLSAPSEDHPASKLGGVSASATPLIQQLSQGSNHSHVHTPVSRHGSPHSLLDSISSARSVPVTPLNGLSGTPAHLKTPGTPHTPETHTLSARLSTQLGDAMTGAGDLQASLSRLSQSPYENGSLTFTSIQPNGLDEAQYSLESVYGINGGLDTNRYNSYGYDGRAGANPSVPSNGTSGSTALYHHNGSRYGLGIPGRVNGLDNKMNGLHGPKHKRGDMDREFNRFAGTRLEDLQGEIAALCKDQHGCRYLQKKLEEGVPEHRDMIFRETFGHFADLMTDPFGNYLCQKLLEYSTDEQRNVICESVAQDLVNISLNMHGTRAVQKMVDFLSTRRQADHRYNAQIHSIIVALSLHVVVLIKDLNGNHVIQKCLNKLAPEDNQFIYNAVAANCVEVATHRHGCCVLQRCIDHASDHQRVQLVNEITYNALTLVQDPYGNYVVQYILDLNDNRFSDAVIRQFAGNVCALSVQKFSSNVIEKCVRVAEHSTRKMLIEELLNRTRLEKLLRDSYGNYCVQTALDYAEPAQRALLVDGIRPILPLIRNTPYGKRIQNKLQREQMDHFGGYHGQQNVLGLGTPGMGSPHGHGGHGGRHMPQPIHQSNPLTDVYGAQNSLYSMPQSQPSFGQAHMGASPLHGLQPQSIDGYVLQNNSSHNQPLSSSHSHGGGFSGASFANVAPFSGAGLSASVGDHYQRSSFGYGM
ncbi:Pumilio domain-containing protein C6G9.14 [Hypsizygus marmoreus]|uniref:Pumilio domain-containing protein C6G9.14 n=1 Tax=Hypsizygus marmoreus TaxID=39966 RepID=A0A369K4R1_HYPMA|nr:Pumilio domain-containing protein C6G9.14 [Hypsizygus marmoreus]